VPGGREWLDRLPEVAQACADAWGLRLGEPYNGGKVGLALRVERSDGSPAVLKINFPDRDTEHEAIALGLWRGIGAVRLLEYDDELCALLIERCDPGNQLSDVPDEDEANTAAARVLASIWRAPPKSHPFGLLADDAARRVKELPARWNALGRPFERLLLDAGVAAYRELGQAQEGGVVCHQDFHGGNILRATREPWLAIDPKPLVGERAFDTAWLLRDRRASILTDPAPAPQDAPPAGPALRRARARTRAHARLGDCARTGVGNRHRWRPAWPHRVCEAPPGRLNDGWSATTAASPRCRHGLLEPRRRCHPDGMAHVSGKTT
jgi:streptomycin 6-kinase